MEDQNQTKVMQDGRQYYKKYQDTEGDLMISYGYMEAVQTL